MSGWFPSKKKPMLCNRANAKNYKSRKLSSNKTPKQHTEKVKTSPGKMILNINSYIFKRKNPFYLQAKRTSCIYMRENKTGIKLWQLPSMPCVKRDTLRHAAREKTNFANDLREKNLQIAWGPGMLGLKKGSTEDKKAILLEGHCGSQLRIHACHF